MTSAGYPNGRRHALPPAVLSSCATSTQQWGGGNMGIALYAKLGQHPTQPAESGARCLCCSHIYTIARTNKGGKRRMLQGPRCQRHGACVASSSSLASGHADSIYVYIRWHTMHISRCHTEHNVSRTVKFWNTMLAAFEMLLCPHTHTCVPQTAVSLFPITPGMCCWSVLTSACVYCAHAFTSPDACMHVLLACIRLRMRMPLTLCTQHTQPWQAGCMQAL
jgi:hypothetical protein